MSNSTKAEYKIIADHLRSSSFLIADGILPGNEGRDYVLRRIMRRAMLQLFKLGAEKITMYKFVDTLIAQMGEAYPELAQARDLIIETLKNEEEKFRSTLKNGLKIIDAEILDMKTKNKYAFDAKIAFKLHDTYGFPLDLTQIILNEKSEYQKFTIDHNDFDAQMKTQKEMARASWKGGGEESLDEDVLKLQSEFGETNFTGYEQNLHDKTHGAKILFISNNSSEVQKISKTDELKNCYIILDKTPFYATSGGQRGDSGQIKSTDLSSVTHIKEAKKIGKLFIHQVKSINGDFGEFHKNQEIVSTINEHDRNLRTYNHSATHLMHKALRFILGNSISQKGSNVEKDYFTFDFNLNRAMTEAEIEEVEKIVNFYIAQAGETKTATMSLDDARKSGAQALFGEKYDNEVRVVSIGQKENDSPYSIELCGGTHVRNSSDIEFFKIISEKSIASGIRRIEGRTQGAAKKYIIDKLANLSDKITTARQLTKVLKKEVLEINPQEEIPETREVKFDENLSDIEKFDSQKIAKEIKLAEEVIKQDAASDKSLTKKLNQLKQNQLLKQLDDIKIEKIGEVNLITHVFNDVLAKDLTQIANNLKLQHKDSSITLLFAKNGDKISALIQISQDLLEKYDASSLIKTIVSNIGAKGAGGKKDFAMTGGNNPQGASDAIETIKNEIK